MVKDPVCGMTIEESNAAAQESYQGVSVYFCSDSCHSKFMANPSQYVQAEKLKDPVCGMDVTTDSGHHAEHAGLDYYFCSDSCLDKFKAAPANYS